MKLNSSTLKQLIKEELQHLLQEQEDIDARIARYTTGVQKMSAQLDGLYKKLDQCRGSAAEASVPAKCKSISDEIDQLGKDINAQNTAIGELQKKKKTSGFDAKKRKQAMAAANKHTKFEQACLKSGGSAEDCSEKADIKVLAWAKKRCRNRGGKWDRQKGCQGGHRRSRGEKGTGPDSLRRAINKACFGAKVTNLAAARKANKCPKNPNMTYKQWRSGRIAARKGNKKAVDEILKAGGVKQAAATGTEKETAKKGMSPKKKRSAAKAAEWFNNVYLRGSSRQKESFVKRLAKLMKKHPNNKLLKYLSHYIKLDLRMKTGKAPPKKPERTGLFTDEELKKAEDISKKRGIPLKDAKTIIFKQRKASRPATA